MRIEHFLIIALPSVYSQECCRKAVTCPSLQSISKYFYSSVVVLVRISFTVTVSIDPNKGTLDPCTVPNFSHCDYEFCQRLHTASFSLFLYLQNPIYFSLAAIQWQKEKNREDFRHKERGKKRQCVIFDKIRRCNERN